MNMCCSDTAELCVYNAGSFCSALMQVLWPLTVDFFLMVVGFSAAVLIKSLWRGAASAK